MTSTTRTGLVAAIITSLFAGCLLGGILLTAPPADRTTPPEPVRQQPPSPQKKGEGDFDYVLRHRWWQQPPTPAKLEQAVATMLACQRRDVVWFDGRCNTAVTSSPADLPAQYGSGAIITKPDQWPDRNIHVFLGGATRPTRDDVLRKLAVALDVADYD